MNMRLNPKICSLCFYRNGSLYCVKCGGSLGEHRNLVILCPDCYERGNYRMRCFKCNMYKDSENYSACICDDCVDKYDLTHKCFNCGQPI